MSKTSLTYVDKVPNRKKAKNSKKKGKKKKTSASADPPNTVNANRLRALSG